MSQSSYDEVHRTNPSTIPKPLKTSVMKHVPCFWDPKEKQTHPLGFFETVPALRVMRKRGPLWRVMRKRGPLSNNPTRQSHDYGQCAEPP